MESGTVPEDERVAMVEHFAGRRNRELEMRPEHFVQLPAALLLERNFGFQHGRGEGVSVGYPLRTEDVVEMAVGEEEKHRL